MTTPSPAEVVGILADKQRQVDQLAARLARLDAHRPTIQAMARTLTRLTWWQWRRRRNLQYQLAQSAISLAETQETR